MRFDLEICRTHRLQVAIPKASPSARQVLLQAARPELRHGPFAIDSRDVAPPRPPGPVFDAHNANFTMSAVPWLRAVPERWPSIRREPGSGRRA
jgi:hypothetical protein